MDEIIRVAAGLAPGQSRSGLMCPYCLGGASGERSLSVYQRDDGLGYGWRCHRASCGKWGGSLSPDQSGPTTKAPAFEARPYTFPTCAPPSEHPIWGLLGATERTPATAARIGLACRVGNPGELVWAVRNYDWLTVGHMSRDYATKTIRTWRTVDEPWFGYFSDNRGPCLWVVEDPVSAAKIQLTGGGAVCLFGSSIGRGVRLGLARLRERGHLKRLLMALDPDATTKGAQYARDLTNSGVCDTLWVPLGSDIKDIPVENLEVLRMSYERQQA